jgi:hypothetical protein
VRRQVFGEERLRVAEHRRALLVSSVLIVLFFWVAGEDGGSNPHEGVPYPVRAENHVTGSDLG